MKRNLYDQTMIQDDTIDALKRWVAKSSCLSLIDSLDMVSRTRETCFVAAEVGEVEEMVNVVGGMIAADDRFCQIRMLVQKVMQWQR